jgi:hypothetical protein
VTNVLLKNICNDGLFLYIEIHHLSIDTEKFNYKILFKDISMLIYEVIFSALSFFCSHLSSISKSKFRLFLFLPEPDFVSSVEDDNHVFFFFRESAVEYMNCGKVNQALTKHTNLKLLHWKNIVLWQANG